MEKPVWKVRSSSRTIDSPYLHIRCDEVELPDGSILPEYYVREAPGFTMVFALTPSREVVLIHEYRYGIDAVLLEIPAGTLNPGEDPLTCAKRELLEETGYTAPRWEPLLVLPSEPSRSNAVLHAFIALDAVETGTTQHDQSEHIETVLIPLADVRASLAAGNVAGWMLGPTSLATIATARAAIEKLRALERG
jgi:8-oxo-dGTP pyrophosphatase MutT (NUDIX family)